MTNDKLAQVLDTLHNQIEQMASSEDWRRYLGTAARFHNYSANNIWLIMAQRPEATRVAGFRTWLSLGRHVRKGEKGIAILAPLKFTKTVTDDDGEESTYSGLRGFRVVYVFDISQTEGESLPSVSAPTQLVGDGCDQLVERLTQLITDQGFTLATPDPWPHGRANGVTEYLLRRVSMRTDYSRAQYTKTLAHETAHVLMHGPLSNVSRPQVEVEAESVAFVVCQTVGLDSVEYSLPYVAAWSGGDMKLVKQTAERVIQTAGRILAAVGVEAVAAPA